MLASCIYKQFLKVPNYKSGSPSIEFDLHAHILSLTMPALWTDIDQTYAYPSQPDIGIDNTYWAWSILWQWDWVFQPEALYSVDGDLQNLEDVFTETEIFYAIKQLARNKASGPDGIPNEFVQLVLSMIQHFFSNNLELKEINRANLVMIPKKRCLRESVILGQLVWSI